MSADKDQENQQENQLNNVEKGKSPKKGFSLLKLALFLFMVVLIAGVSLYAFMDINPADFLAEGFNGIYSRVFTTGIQTLSESVKEIAAYDSGARLSCATVSNDLAVADVNSVRVYDSEGQEKAYIPISLQKPYIQAYQKYILIADLEGRYFSLMSDGRLLWEKNIDEDIVNAEVSQKWILLITKSKQSGYKRTIRAYSMDGQEISFRNVSNYYPFAASYYPEFNESSFIVNGLEASGLEATGLFEFLDPSMNQTASIRGNNEIFAGGIPVEKGRLFLYGEKSLQLIDKSFHPVWNKKLTDSTVTAAAVLNGKTIVTAELNDEVLLRESRHETTVRILHDDSSEKAKLVIDNVVSGIYTKGKTAAVKAGSEIFFINASGKIMDRYTSKSDVSGVYLASDKLAYVLSSGTISRIQVKGTHKLLGLF